MIYLDDFRGDWTAIKKALPTLLEQYEAEIAAAPERLSLAGKTGPQALKEQCAWPVHYGMLKVEVTKLLKHIDSRIDAVRGELTRRYVETYSRDIGERVRERYIDNEESYIKARGLYLEIEEIRDKLAAICEAFDKRGFALRDWTALKVSELTDLTI